MKRASILLVVVLLAACAGTPKMNNLAVGMTKAEVIETMGRSPDSTSAKGNVEYLTYGLWRDFWDRRPGDYSDQFYVRLIKGKVESFGRVGDFDSTQLYETKQTIDLNVRHK